MVAIFVGQGAGVARGSANLLGGAGLLGSGLLGRGGENVSVNAATGNVLITQQDEFLVGRGLDIGVSRTYNSLAQMSDGDNGDKWQQSTTQRVFGLTGTLNTSGSTISRLGGDGSVIVYSYATIGGTAAYWTTDGDGAHDKLVKSGATWVWTDGSSQVVETYEATVANPTTDFRIKERKDTDNLKLTFTYVASTDRIARITTANHGLANTATGTEKSYVDYIWDTTNPDNLASIVTGYTHFGDPLNASDDVDRTATRTSYSYESYVDGSVTKYRLKTVAVDLTPDNTGDSSSFVTTYSYNTTNRVTRIQTTDGVDFNIDYNGAGKVWRFYEVLAGGNRITTLTYEAGYTAITYDGQVTELHYDASQRLTKVKIPTAEDVEFFYDADGNVERVRDIANKDTVYTHDASGNILTVSDPNGNGATRTYGSKNELLTETRTILNELGSPVSLTTRYAYDSKNHLRYVVSPEGRVTEYRYTAYGELSYVVEFPEHSYTALGVPSETDLNSWKTNLGDLSSIAQVNRTYDTRGNLLQTNQYGIAMTNGLVSQAEGFNRTYTIYDQAGRLLSRALFGETAETFTYDGLGRLIASNNPASGATTIYFEDALLRTTVTTSTGHTSVSTYSKSGELLSVATSANSGSYDVAGTTAYKYDKLGRVRMITTPRGVATPTGSDYNSFILYDNAGRRTADIAGDGSVVEYRYDAAGRLAATIAYTTKLTAPQMGSLAATGGITTIASWRPAADAEDIWSWNVYDDGGRLVQKIEGDGAVTSYAYDKADRLIKTTAFAIKLSAATLGNLKSTPPVTPVSTTSLAGGERISRTFYDKDGLLVATLDGEGYLAEFKYDQAGRKTADIAYGTLTDEIDRAAGSLDDLRPSTTPSATIDRVLRHVYDGQGLLRFQVDHLGYVTGFEYGLNGRARSTATIAYATSIGTAVTDFTFDNIDALTTPLANHADNRESYAVHNAKGQVAYTIDTAGLVTGFTYDGAGRVTRTLQYAVLRSTGGLPALATMDTWASGQSGATGNRVTYNYYSEGGDLRFTVDAEGYVSRFDYDADGNLITEVRFATAISVTPTSTIADVGTLATGASISVSHLYDMAGRRYETIDGEGFRTRREWDGAGNLVTVHDAYLSVTTSDRVRTDYGYDGAGRLISETRAVGEAEVSTIEYSYDGLGNLVTVTDPLDKITYNYYDDIGQLIAVRDRADHVTRMTYNAFGEVVSSTRFANATASGDTNVPPVVTANPAKDVVSYSYYDRRGRLTYTVDGEKYVTRSYYNGFGDVVKTVRYATTHNATAGTTIADLDTAFGNEAATPPLSASVTSYAHDKRGQVLTTTAAVDGTTSIVTTSTYDAFGQLKTVSRELAPASLATTSFDYDKRGLVKKTTDAEGFFESYTYDAYGNRETVTAKSKDANKVAGGTTIYTYDKRGLLRTETLPVAAYLANGTEQAGTITNKYSYDGRGNRTQVIEAFGLTEARTTNFTYDKLDRLTKTTHQSFQGLMPEDEIAYDAAGNVIRTIDAADSKTVYFYDNLGRKRVSVDMAGTYSSFTYDANGNLTETRVYESLLTTIPETGGLLGAAPATPTIPTSAYRISTFTYDRLGRLKTSDVAGASGGSWNSVTSAWDAYTNATLTSTFVYDAFGNVVKTTDANGKSTWNYFDRVGNKTHQVDATNHLTKWTYDSEGNVLTEIRYGNPAAAPSGTETPPAVTANNALDRTTSFTYDKNGNRLSESRSDVLVHDGSGGTTSVTATINWRYNGLGQVVRRTEATGDTNKNVGELGDESTYYTYDVGGRLIEEKRASFVDYSTVSTPVIVTPEVDYHYNGLGDLVHTVAAGAGTVLQRETSYAYSGGKLVSVTDAEGFVRRYKYDVMGRVTHDYYTRIKSDNSNAFAYEGTLTQYDVLGRTTKQWQATSTDATTWTAASPVLSTLYTSYGEVWKTGLNAASVADGNRVWQTENIYDAAGRLRASNSGDAVWKYFAYDKVGNQTAAITNAGYASFAGLSFADAQALSTHVTHGAKVNATYTVYDARNMAVAVVEEGRQLTASTTATVATSRTYNAFGEVATETNALNGVTTYSYNKAGRLLRREGPTVQITHENGLTQWVKPSEDYYYDRSGRLVATRDANGEYASGGTLESSPVSKLANKGNLTQLTLLAGTGYGGGEALVTSEAYVDGGTKSVKYDIHGDARVTIDEVGRRREQLYDRLGRVTVVTHPGDVGQQLVERFAYDGLGQRIRHWNNQLNPLDTTTGLTGEVATTDYDVQGRVTSVRAFGGDVTTTSFAWDAAISALSGVSLGGWSEVTTMANGRTLSEKSDLYGRVTWKEDLGDHVTQYVYDVAGRQIESTTGYSKNVFTWYNSGQIATLATGTINAGQVNSVWSRQTAVYGYDKMGNRVAETLTKELSEYQPAGMVWDGDGWIEVTEYYYVNVTPIKNQSATYDAMGRLKTWDEAGTNFSPIASTTHQYDANGNIRKTHTEFRMVDANGGYASSATSNDYWFAFDGRNRLVVDKGVLSGTAGAVGTTIVRGTTGTTIFYNVAGEREWAETSGVQISLSAWRRTAWGQNTYYHFRQHEDDGSQWVQITLTQVGSRREKYEYDAAGRLSAIKQQDSEISFVDGASSVGVGGLGQAKTRSLFGYDKMGRMKSQDDYNAAGTSIVFSRDLHYNDKGQLIEDDSSTVKTDGYTYRTITRNDYGTGAGYALGSLVQTQSDSYRNGNDGDFTDTATKYTFEWFDSAVQKTIKHDKSYGNNDDPNTYGMTQGATLSGFDDDTSSLSILNDFGQVIQAQITDGQSRNVYFTLDELGQVLRREETRPSNAPSVQTGAPNEIWYRFAGREMGYTGNNSSAADTNFEAIAERQAPSPNPYGTFRGGSTNAISYGDLTNSYDAITSFDQGSAGGSYTVRGGDTLSSIAQSLYGDAGLWYKIAEANGMSGNVPLVEGQALTLPSGVVRSTHNASTFKPYDPAEAIGDLSPTAPKPPKKPKCGVFGMILVAAIAIGLSVWLGPQFAKIAEGAFAFMGAAAGTAGAIVGGAAAAAVGSVVSQGVGVAAGIQDKFSWKSVGMAALGGAVGGALKGVDVFAKGSLGSATNVANDVARGLLSSAATQGLGRVTGLQSKFDFAGVAAAGVAAGVGSALGGKLKPLAGEGSSRTLSNIAGHVGVGAARLFANAATRSAIQGNNFGDNILAALPDTLGQIIGEALGGAIAGDPSRNEIVVTGNYDLRGLSVGESVIAANPTMGAGTDVNTATESAPLSVAHGEASGEIVVTGTRSRNSVNWSAVDYGYGRKPSGFDQKAIGMAFYSDPRFRDPGDRSIDPRTMAEKIADLLGIDRRPTVEAPPSRPMTTEEKIIALAEELTLWGEKNLRYGTADDPDVGMLAREWRTGEGPRVREFDQDMTFTIDFANADNTKIIIDRALNEYRTRPGGWEGKEKDGSSKDGALTEFKGKFGPGGFINSTIDERYTGNPELPIVFDPSLDQAAHWVGSFRLLGQTMNDSHTVIRWSAWNETDLRSFAAESFTGRQVIENRNRPAPFGNTYQSIEWYTDNKGNIIKYYEK